MNGDSATVLSMYNQNERGFIFIGALILIVTVGITLNGISVYHRTLIKRSKEAELLFRGDQIRRAIRSYYEHPPPGKPRTYPYSMQALLKDPRYLGVRRHLRKLYAEPMTRDREWGFVRNAKGGIQGVFSPSQERPLKIGNFPERYKHFEVSQKSQAKTEAASGNKVIFLSEENDAPKHSKYSDWKFVFRPKSVNKNSE